MLDFWGGAGWIGMAVAGGSEAGGVWPAASTAAWSDAGLRRERGFLDAADFARIQLREREALPAEVLERSAEAGNPASRAAASRRRGPDWNSRGAWAQRPEDEDDETTS